MSDPSAFGRRLKQLRQEQGLTQELLAERVGCATQTIRKIESGTRRPSFQMAARLAQVLGIAADERADFVSLARVASGSAEPEPSAPTAEPEPTGTAPPAGLPTPLTRLIAREQDVAAAQYLLRDAGVRLLTLVGPGGTGKTRLALEVAASLADHYAAGVVFVNLTPIRDPGLVVPTIADRLGIHEQGGQPRHERLKQALSAKELLLVLDNFEQIVAAAPAVADLLTSCPGVQVLVTSRELLRVRGEHAFPVDPLPVPDTGQVATGEQIAHYPAVQLFIERAVAVRPDFVVSDENAAAVAELCRRLDGLPLAIELAAARSTLLPPEALLARLDSRLKLLTGGARDLPARQQTLRNTIAWSYDLLTDSEQKLFRRLCVFVGGRTLSAVEAVCAAAGDQEWEVLDGLASLVDKSLLRQHATPGDEPRFLMLETIWEYGLEQLEQSGEAQATRRAHAGYYLQLVEQAERHLWGGEQDRWLERLEQEHGNVRAALGWYIAQEDGAEPALQMAGWLWRFWEMRGHWSEGQQWLERALLRRSQADPAALWIALHGAGNLALAKGEYARATAYYEDSLAVTRRLGLKKGIANSLLNLSSVSQFQGDYRRAIALQEEALAIHREVDNQIGIALALSNLSIMYEHQGDYDRATAFAEQSLARYTELRDSRGVAFALHELAIVAHRRGLYAQASKLLEECRTIFQKLNAKNDLAGILNDLGELHADLGELHTAGALYDESLRLATELGDRRRQAAALNNKGRLAHRLGDGERAELLCSKSLALYRELGDKRGAAMALESLGHIAYRQGAATRAALLFEESLALAQATGDRPGVARCLEGLAMLTGAEDRPKQAVRR